MSDMRRLIEEAWAAVSASDWDALERCFAPTYVRHSDGGVQTFDEFCAILKEERRAFPDMATDLTDFVCSGDRVAFCWSSRATHLGAYFGVPPTGRRVSVSGITLSRIEDGRIVQDWASWSKHELLGALGIIPIESPLPTAHEAPDEPSASPDVVRDVHRRFATGVTIVTTHDDDGPAGLAVNAFSSISLDPPLVLVCVGKASLTYPRLFARDHVAVNILSSAQEAIARVFAQSGGDKFAGVSWQPGRNGAPLFEGCAARLEAVIERRIPAYTHTIFIARVTAADAFDREPLIYLAGSFVGLR